MGTDPSADSGAKTDRGGTMPPSLGRDWHEGDKSKRVQSVAYIKLCLMGRDITNRKVQFRLNHYKNAPFVCVFKLSQTNVMRSTPA